MADNTILAKLEGIREKYASISEQITDPEVMSDMKRYIQLNKEYKELGPIVEAADKYRTAIANLQEAKDILANEKDEEMREMARGEIEELEPKIAQLEEDIKLMLIPADPQDSKNAIVEIRGGAGGDEAAIFAGDLLRMYLKFFERKGWKAEINSESEGTSGGYKEVVLKVTGENVYGTLKYESGVHRVQRVPQTETQGRVHTSAASVAVLPEAEEFDIDLKMEDIRKDTFCASGPGGQSVNTTYSAIRLTHIPTGSWCSARTRSRSSRISTRRWRSCGRGFTTSNTRNTWTKSRPNARRWFRRATVRRRSVLTIIRRAA